MKLAMRVFVQNV